MFLRIETFPSKKFVGFSLQMSLANNRTYELWSKFMPRRKEIKNAIGTDLYSLQIFKANYNLSDLHSTFKKWAAIAVESFDEIPLEMETLSIPTGKYAVFLHRGPASEGYKTFQYIFGTWLPNSGYLLDDRPHFEVLGEKYKNNETDSEEEIFIPIK